MSKFISEFDFAELIKEESIQNILTSDSESICIELSKNKKLDIVSLMPFDNFIERVIEQIKSAKYDLIFLSHVFFNSGMALENIDHIYEICIKEKINLAIDVRLSFFLPINFSADYFIQTEMPTFLCTHEEVHSRQNKFREQLPELDHFFLCEKNILSVNYNYHGAFITFALPSNTHAKQQQEELKQHGICCEVIENRLRFNFLTNENFDLSFLKIK
jgi:hypothetical protein